MGCDPWGLARHRRLLLAPVPTLGTARFRSRSALLRRSSAPAQSPSRSAPFPLSSAPARAPGRRPG
ncbi:hypothetical protein FM106_19510 [Brachybacterium faecium]|nr:hypothetical protein FM106_19510 [Brachybacterium faecium]